MAFLTFKIPDTAKARLDDGAVFLLLDDLGDAPGVEPGRPVRLVDRQNDPVASAVADPENGVLRIWGGPGIRAFDGPFFRSRIRSALALRHAAGLPGPEESFRLINGDGDGLAGLTVDVYGAFAVVCAPGRGLLGLARGVAEAVLAEGTTLPTPLRGVVVKVRAKDPQEKSNKDEVIGERPPEKLVVRERGVPYEVHLLGALNVGLFTDMREHRFGLRRFCKGRRVLNTFAYTGTLSVAAALAGASAVTSVDLSSGVLAWTKENFRLSGLDPHDSRFVFETSDVRKYLENLHADQISYDVIILDPPTVSGARASQWTMKRDYPDLIARAAKLLPPAGGALWVSANSRKGPSIMSYVQDGMARAGRRGALMELGSLPPDYPTAAGSLEGRYLEVAWIWVSGI